MIRVGFDETWIIAKIGCMMSWKEKTKGRIEGLVRDGGGGWLHPYEDPAEGLNECLMSDSMSVSWVTQCVTQWVTQIMWVTQWVTHDSLMSYSTLLPSNKKKT